ncbi:hypothetical protein HW571_13995 [Agrobacterium genomosp. 3]|uniref:hypothetical protein n=1 Tax=Agrobacterium tomkonis TaxID=1183410 RepID=UPI001CD8B472|nr:hypothetical protein [Agrobacterium tomkonis]MCA1877145.1 hypothetical protein [Agrobacterium tumefaciens]MCA1892356.1 hypothetical protein [Agrobacterium tomkonis]
MTENDPGEIPVRIEAYKYASRQKTIDGIRSAFGWLEQSRRKDRFDVVRMAIEEQFLNLEGRVLGHFQDYVGGKDFIHKDQAWLLACRQREFVRECCARMAEGKDEEPTALSEAIRELQIGPDVKIIPDYSKRIA